MADEENDYGQDDTNNNDEGNADESGIQDTLGATEAGGAEPEVAEVEAVAKEILPDAKPFSGEFTLEFRDIGSTLINAKDINLPEWLPFLLADDFFWFRRTLIPPTVAAPVVDGSPPAESLDTDDKAPNVANTVFTLQPNSTNGYDLIIAESQTQVKPTSSISSVVLEPMGRGADTKKEDEEADAEEALREAQRNEAASVDTKASLPEFSVDAITLAALFSASALKFFLNNASTSLTGLQQWMTSQGVADGLLENIAFAKSAHKLKMDFNEFFKVMRFDQNFDRVVDVLVKANIYASKPIEQNLLTTPVMIMSFLRFLYTMPRSQLALWTQPKRDGDDQNEEGGMFAQPLSYLLGTTLLDLRRRDARSANGKKNLRVTPEEALKKILPQKPEQCEGPDDVVCVKEYGVRTYYPNFLTLYHSDLTLIALGLFAQHENLDGLFLTLLRAKLGKTRQVDDNVGTIHLLMHLLYQLKPEIGQLVISECPSWKVFTPTGIANVKDFVLGAAGSFETFRPDLVKQFCVKFYGEFLLSPNAILALERSAPTILSEIEKCQLSQQSLLDGVKNGSVNSTSLQSFVESGSLHTNDVYSPCVLKVALSAKNLDVVSYLIRQRNIVTVQCEWNTSGKDVLEAALDLQDVAALQCVIESGVSLNALIHKGIHSGFSHVQALPDFVDYMAALDKWRCMEKDRIADPLKKHGLLRNIADH